MAMVAASLRLLDPSSSSMAVLPSSSFPSPSSRALLPSASFQSSSFPSSPSSAMALVPYSSFRSSSMAVLPSSFQSSAFQSTSFPSSSSSVAVLRRMQVPKPNRHQHLRVGGAARASSEFVEPLALSSADPDLTWQVTAGAIAGVSPFVIAGIEFSKRIIQQRRCQVCNGSGLVKRAGGILVRCNGCGGFLPWQSWRRFFSSGR